MYFFISVAKIMLLLLLRKKTRQKSSATDSTSQREYILGAFLQEQRFNYGVFLLPLQSKLKKKENGDKKGRIRHQ